MSIQAFFLANQNAPICHHTLNIIVKSFRNSWSRLYLHANLWRRGAHKAPFRPSFHRRPLNSSVLRSDRPLPPHFEMLFAEIRSCGHFCWTGVTLSSLCALWQPSRTLNVFQTQQSGGCCARNEDKPIEHDLSFFTGPPCLSHCKSLPSPALAHPIKLNLNARGRELQLWGPACPF